MWITKYLKRKKITTSDTMHSDNSYLILDNSSNDEFSTIKEKYSCWSVLFIDGLEIEAKIIHKGRGKFKIVEDNYNAKYVGKIVDASDVIRCKLKPNDVNIFMRNKLAQFSNQKQYITEDTSKLEFYVKVAEHTYEP